MVPSTSVKPKRSTSQRVPINPFRSEMTGGNHDDALLDLGTGLLKDIVGDTIGDVARAFQNIVHSPLTNQRTVAPTSIGQMPQDSSTTAIDVALMLPQNLSQTVGNHAFNICYRLSEIIPQTEFDDMVEKLYLVQPAFWGLDEYDNIALLSAIMAIAHSVDGHLHQILGCAQSIEKSETFFQISNDILDRNHRQITSITQLRTVTSMILYRLITKNAAATSDLLNIACMATINLGLYDEFAFSEQIDDNENAPKQNLLWTILYFDIYLSGLLAKPTFVDVSGSEGATLATIQHAARNVGRCVRSSKDFILTVGLALQIELFKLMRQGARVKRNEDVAQLRQVKQDLLDWEALFISIFPQDEVVNVVARTRFELRMCHYLAVISLCSPFIRSFVDDAPMPNPKVALRKELRLWCITVATQAVDATVVYCRLPGHAPLVEPSAYVLFVAVICLIVASDGAIDVKGVSTKISQALELMTHIACFSFGETNLYLNIAKEMMLKYGLLNPDAAISNAIPILPSMVSHGQLIKTESNPDRLDG